MANSYTDGDIIADSFDATIAGQTYVVNNLSLTTPTVQVERNDNKGKLAAKKTETDTFRTNGTAELQITVTAENQELVNETFEVPADVNSTGTAFTCVIEEETGNVAANEARTRSVNVRRVVVEPV